MLQVSFTNLVFVLAVVDLVSLLCSFVCFHLSFSGVLDRPFLIYCEWKRPFSFVVGYENAYSLNNI